MGLQISTLPLAALPLAGDETIPLVQDGDLVRAQAAELIGPLLPLMTPHPVPQHFGVDNPGAGVNSMGGSHWTALATVCLPGTVLDGLTFYSAVATTISVRASEVPTNVVDGRLSATSYVPRVGATLSKSVPVGVSSFSAAELAALGDVSGRVVEIQGTIARASGSPSNAQKSAFITPGTDIADTAAMAIYLLQVRLDFHTSYSYTLDYTGEELLSALAERPSANTRALRQAARVNGFFPQPSWRASGVEVPVVTLGGAGANSAINGRSWVSPMVLGDSSKLQWLNGPLATDGSGAWKPRGAWFGAARDAQYAALEFTESSGDFELAFAGSFYGAANNLRILADDVVVWSGSLPSNTGATYYLRCQFGSARARRIRIEGANGKFRGINVADAGSVVATGRVYPLIPIIGDSFCEGTGATFVQDGQAVSLVRAIGGDPVLGAVGGTGMLNPGTGGKVAWTDATRLTDLTMAGVTDALGRSTAPAMGIVRASINDQSAPQAWWNGAANYQQAVTKAAFIMIDAWIAANPGKPLVFFGPTWTSGNPVLDIYRLRDGIQEACWAAAGDNVHFIDLLEPAPVLRSGTRSYTATTGTTTNASPVITGLASTAAIQAPGSGIEGPGIPAGATVVSIDGPTQVTINLPATATAAGVALTFRNDQAALYQFGPSDLTHPGQAGHVLDALATAAKLRALILGQLT